jgi:pyruvate formate lyase activating enzyme
MLKIKGFQKTSLIDYPGKICSVLFLPGCNYRCPYCQNPDLIKNPDKLPDIKEDYVLSFLEKRKKLIDGVCITGGEPTIHKELPTFIKKIKEQGLLVKLDTNGSNPEIVEQLIKNKLIDYVAMDVKAPLEKYNEVVRVNVDIEKIKETIRILMTSNIDYEFRTTVLPKFHKKEDLLKIAKLIKGAKKYYLQQFRALVTLDKTFENEATYTEKELNNFVIDLKPYFNEVGVRT